MDGENDWPPSGEVAGTARDSWTVFGLDSSGFCTAQFMVIYSGPDDCLFWHFIFTCTKPETGLSSLTTSPRALKSHLLVLLSYWGRAWFLTVLTFTEYLRQDGLCCTRFLI